MLEIFDHIQNTFSILFMLSLTVTSMVAQTVKCLPTMPETRVQSLGREDILEKRMATHSSVLASSPPLKTRTQLRPTTQKLASCDGLRRSVAERSYPLPKVRGSDREFQAWTAQEWPRGATPHSRSGGAVVRNYP